MKYNKQNEKIEMITEDFLIVAIDVGSTTHYARAFDYRGIEYLIIEVLNILRKHFLLKTQIRDLRRSNHGPVL